MELLNQLEGRSAACAHAAVPRRCNPAIPCRCNSTPLQPCLSLKSTFSSLSIATQSQSQSASCIVPRSKPAARFQPCCTRAASNVEYVRRAQEAHRCPTRCPCKGMKVKAKAANPCKAVAHTPHCQLTLPAHTPHCQLTLHSSHSTLPAHTPHCSSHCRLALPARTPHFTLPAHTASSHCQW
jgi:hypothetical protein